MKQSADNCLFCAVLAKQEPSYLIFENEYWQVILDLFPIRIGHVLLISKKHCVDLTQLSKEEFMHAQTIITKVMQCQKNALNASGWQVISNVNASGGQIVQHMHWHVIPYYDDEPYRSQQPRIEAQPSELDEICQKLTMLREH